VAGRSRRGNDQALILALLNGDTVEAAAAQAGMGERTVYRRLGDSAFQRQLSQTRTRYLQQAIGVLARRSVEAAGHLQHLAAHAETDSARVSAARHILDLSLRATETLDLAERVAALEAKLEAPAEARRPRIA